MPKTVKCPKCGNPSEYSPSNPYRPFCSQRCQLIDLGQWADEKYTIPTPEETATKEDPGDLPGEDEG